MIIPKATANKASFVLFGSTLVATGGLFSLAYSFEAFWLAWQTFLLNYLHLGIFVIGGMAAHELLHVLVWSLSSRQGIRSISIGFDVRQLAPYVHCSEFLTLRSYAIGVALPGIVLGVLPLLASLLYGSGYLLCFGVFFTAGAAGDFLSLYYLKSVPHDAKIKDHPEHLGFLVKIR